jgi:hypothetical protein
VLKKEIKILRLTINDIRGQGYENGSYLKGKERIETKTAPKLFKQNNTK